MRREYGTTSLFAQRFITLIALQVFRASRSSRYRRDAVAEGAIQKDAEHGGAGFFDAGVGSGRPDDRPLDEVGVAAEQGLGGQVAAQRAARHGAIPAAIALAWTIGPDPVVVIPGASSIGQLEANAAAADIILSRDEQPALAAAASEVRASTGGELRRG